MLLGTTFKQFYIQNCLIKKLKCIFIFSGFVLEDWLSTHNYADTVPLSDFAVTMLVDDLQIGSYLLEEQCSAGVALFIPNTGNWNKGLKIRN